MSEELKPCPFCGGTAARSHYDTFGCRSCAIWMPNGKESDWNRRTASTIPASEGEPTAYMGLDGKVYPASVGRICTTDEPLFRRAVLASTRTASDTRTAAGEAECDAALGRAAPAGQHDSAGAVAWRRVDWDSGKWIFTDQQPTEEIAWEGLCVAKPAARRAGVSVDAERPAFDLWWRASKYCQVVTPKAGWVQIALDGWMAKARTASTDAATRSRAEGGNTQSVSVESTRPAEVDVEAELRKAIENPTIYEAAAFRKGFRAARTQADAGKDSPTTKPENT